VTLNRNSTWSTEDALWPERRGHRLDFLGHGAKKALGLKAEKRQQMTSWPPVASDTNLGQQLSSVIAKVSAQGLSAVLIYMVNQA
jgi:hypothetical protein